MWDEHCRPIVFQCRSEARAFALKKYGYIKTRKDLRAEPHCWRMPVPVKLTGIVYESSKMTRPADGGK